MDEQVWVDILICAAGAGSETLNEFQKESPDVSELNGEVGAGGDLTTRYDLVAENAIIKYIKNCGQKCNILTEEAGYINLCGSEQNIPLIIIDPLDGTNNYKQGFPFACISICLWYGKEAVVGLVHDLALNKNYVATKGGGAWAYNDDGNKRLSVSGIQNAKEAFITMIRPVTTNDYNEMAKLFFGVKTVRMVVSAALEMAYVAAGKTDAFVDVAYNKKIKKGGVRFVDFAAGKLLVEEAGGYVWGDNIKNIITDYDVSEQTNLIASASRELVDELIRLRWHNRRLYQ
jgi:myo-inositol-1(or 4)-monophosphatase